ncbi:MAG TPA: Mu transposase C-terminal domain-containing protein [Verrucomicrobiae bacterium]|nr:Mu transposase C-terminal domain-containing protein [Verrucomicrobiae bacterium]
MRFSSPCGRRATRRSYATCNLSHVSEEPQIRTHAKRGVGGNRPGVLDDGADPIGRNTQLVRQPIDSTCRVLEENGFLPRVAGSLEQLDLLLIQVAKTHQVRIDGIHFQSLRYISTTPRTLAAYVGEMVTLRFHPRDMAEIRLFHNGKFLCSAFCPELPGATVPLRELKAARSPKKPGWLSDRLSKWRVRFVSSGTARSQG